jgi:hypothetical protein
MSTDVVAFSLLAGCLGAWWQALYIDSDEARALGDSDVDTLGLQKARREMARLLEEAETEAWCATRVPRALAARRQGLAALSKLVARKRFRDSTTVEEISGCFDDMLYNIRQASDLSRYAPRGA